VFHWGDVESRKRARGGTVLVASADSGRGKPHYGIPLTLKHPVTVAVKSDQVRICGK